MKTLKLFIYITIVNYMDAKRLYYEKQTSACNDSLLTFRNKLMYARNNNNEVLEKEILEKMKLIENNIDVYHKIDLRYAKCAKRYNKKIKHILDEDHNISK